MNLIKVIMKYLSLYFSSFILLAFIGCELDSTDNNTNSIMSTRASASIGIGEADASKQLIANQLYSEIDTGGIVYTYLDKRYTTGIVTGRLKHINPDNSVTSTGSFFTKANLALSLLGVERY